MTMPMPPGWYPAEGDPPGTHRYWDGAQWQGGPQPIPGPAPLGFASPVAQYPETSNALASLLVSIGGFIVCGLLFPVGWWLGSKELEAIRQGRRDPSNKGLAQAGRLIGMIMTVLVMLVLLAAIVVVLVGVSTS